MTVSTIASPQDPALGELCQRLAAGADEMDRSGRWPADQLKLCGEAGVYQWFFEPQHGGHGWSAEESIHGYMALARACLTTTFILTQRTGACRRIAGCPNEPLKQRLLPGLASGELFTTVGISHLTTSRRHLGRPVLTAEETTGGFRLSGMAPWVTGGAAADFIVLAATLVENAKPTDRDLLLAVPTSLPGLSVDEPLPLVGLTASSTGPVRLDRVEVSHDWLIAGPAADAMLSAAGGSTGGYETSALALGLAGAATHFLAGEAEKRPDLKAACAALAQEHSNLVDDLLALVRGVSPTKPPMASPVTSPNFSVRQRANTFVLRATQAALSAAKGTGYVVGHPAGRWCREALFFLVWSCPQTVAAANLCELAGIAD